MNNLTNYIENILKHEGGYVNHPLDRGGPTNMGVTLRTLSRYLGREATIEELKELDTDTVHEIYLSKYFYGPRLDQLPKRIQHVMFDMSINHGPRNAVRMLQRVINQTELLDEKLGVDGIAGSKTFKASKRVDKTLGNYFINALVDERLNFYGAIVARRPDQQIFMRGWTRRAESFRVQV